MRRTYQNSIYSVDLVACEIRCVQLPRQFGARAAAALTRGQASAFSLDRMRGSVREKFVLGRDPAGWGGHSGCSWPGIVGARWTGARGADRPLLSRFGGRTGRRRSRRPGLPGPLRGGRTADSSVDSVRPSAPRYSAQTSSAGRESRRTSALSFAFPFVHRHLIPIRHQYIIELWYYSIHHRLLSDGPGQFWLVLLGLLPGKADTCLGANFVRTRYGHCNSP